MEARGNGHAKRGTWGVTAALALVVAAQTPMAGELSPAETKAAATWRAELISSGGITGRGLGGIAVQSDGVAQLLHIDPQAARPRQGDLDGHAAQSPLQQPATAVTCSTTLDTPQLAALDGALSRVAPEHWRAGTLSRKDAPCCDVIEWQLTLTRQPGGAAEERLIVSWTAGSRADEVPAPVVEVHRALIELWPIVRSACPIDR